MEIFRTMLEGADMNKPMEIKAKHKIILFEGAMTFGETMGKLGENIEQVAKELSSVLLAWGIESITMEFQSEEAKQEYLKEIKRRKLTRKN